MAVVAEEMENTGERGTFSFPDPVITYDHITGHESRRYFNLKNKSTGISTLRLIVEEVILAILAITLFILS